MAWSTQTVNPDPAWGGRAAVERYVAATFKDLGPVGGTVEAALARVADRFPPA